MKSMKIGSKGTEVSALQKALADRGFYKGKIDGDFGPLTEQAVKEFQKQAGLVADGIAGTKTLAAINQKEQEKQGDTKKEIFIDVVRKSIFAGKMKESQIEGIEAIIKGFKKHKLTDRRHLAYGLATAYHETAAAMQPVMETQKPNEPPISVNQAIARLENSWKAGKLPWVKSPYWRRDAEGYSWLGRGYVQLTHKPGYWKAEKETGIPFTKDPNLALVPEHAVTTLWRGMSEGWFTGRKLSDYFNETANDPKEARRIINGVESASEIAKIYEKFLAALS